jgi:hypothetical protein
MDHTLTIEEIMRGFDVSDGAIFADVMAAPIRYQERAQYQRPADFLLRRAGNSYADLMREILAEEAPVRPFAGRRSQFDRG